MRSFTERLINAGRAALLIVAAVQLAGLAACGGGGYGGGGGAGYNMPVAGLGASKLFAADSPHMTVGSLANRNPSAGPIVFEHAIKGLYFAGLSNTLGSLALDPVLDYLYVGNGTSIRVFYMASAANGDVSASRVIFIGSGNTGSMFLDTVHDRLYVGDDANGVKVFDGASMAGSTAMPRLISGNFGLTFQIHGVAVDTTPKDILYVSNTNHTTASDQISVFEGASALSGSPTPNRTITPMTANATVGGIFLDAARDVLYVAGGPGAALVMVFSSASMATGPTPPSKTLSGFPSGILNVMVDTVHDRLYAVGVGGLYIVNAVSSATGTVSATAILPPPGGSLTAVAVNPS